MVPDIMVTPDNRNAAPNPNRAKVSASEVKLRRILRDAPQDLWLETIRRTRSDAHNGLIYWMLSQPECDFAIAAHAFYRSNPAAQLDNPKPLPLRPSASNIFALVLINWDTGFFQTHKLKVEAVDVHPRVLAGVQEKMLGHPRGSLPFSIPRQLLTLDGGTPAYVSPTLSPDDAIHLWAIFADLGLQVPDTAPRMKRRLEQAKGLLKKVGIGYR
jgi:hypothetical protein